MNTQLTARMIAWLTAGIFLLVAAGAIYQAIATESDKRKYPAPGQLVDVGRYRLHLFCVGQGSPTVILEAAADMMSADWGWIQPEIAKQTRVCAYDRAGMGWSEPGPQPRDARQISTELHTLLTNAGIAGPYILVGHLAGGLFTRMYAAQYAEEVVGMVLVDPGHPDMTARIPALEAKNAGDVQLVGTMRTLSYVGFPRLLGIGTANAVGLPSERTAEVNAFVSTPKHWATIQALIDATPATYDEVRVTGLLESRPLVVITERGRHREACVPPPVLKSQGAGTRLQRGHWPIVWAPAPIEPTVLVLACSVPKPAGDSDCPSVSSVQEGPRGPGRLQRTAPPSLSLGSLAPL